jgi:hypothetical protein
MKQTIIKIITIIGFVILWSTLIRAIHYIQTKRHHEEIPYFK